MLISLKVRMRYLNCITTVIGTKYMDILQPELFGVFVNFLKCAYLIALIIMPGVRNET